MFDKSASRVPAMAEALAEAYFDSPFLVQNDGETAYFEMAVAPPVGVLVVDGTLQSGQQRWRVMIFTVGRTQEDFSFDADNPEDFVRALVWVLRNQALNSNESGDTQTAFNLGMLMYGWGVTTRNATYELQGVVAMTPHTARRGIPDMLLAMAVGIDSSALSGTDALMLERAMRYLERSRSYLDN